MQFNGESNNLDLYSEAREWCGIENGDGGATADTSSWPLKRFTRDCNIALDDLHAIIIRADGTWKYDDSNNSASELLDTSKTVSAARSVTIPVTWLKISRVRITITSTGQKIVLRPGDRRTWSTSQLNGDTGTPTEYVVIGNYLYLDASCTGTLEVQYQKGASYFAYTDTTKVPGFASPFHPLVAWISALAYCERNDLDSRAAKLRNKIGRPPAEGDSGAGAKRELAEFYATRQIDDRPTARPQREDYGESALGDSFGGGNPNILLAGIVLFAITTLFSVITLPVEFDASARALKWLESSHNTKGDEHTKAKDALKWAALTYVVAALASIAMLVQYILIYQSRSRD